MKGAATPAWSLCIATIDRADILRLAVEYALAQTIPPREIVVVDASDAWEASRDAIARLAEAAGMPLVYERAEARSLTVQRNQGARHATGEILFFFDDDSLMYRDCAETLLDVYAADTEHRVAAMSAVDRAMPPHPSTRGSTDTGAGDPGPVGSPPSDGTSIAQQGGLLNARRETIARYLRQSRLFAFVFREILLMSKERAFVPYDPPERRAARGIPEALRKPGLREERHLPGFSMTVRRAVFDAEPFDPYLLAYCPAEDLDATYRWGRHGLVLVNPAAAMHHYSAASGRLKRRQVSTLSNLNVAYFVKRNSATPARHIASYYFLTIRRLLAEFIKEALSRRWDFATTRGVMLSLVHSLALFRSSPDDCSSLYVERQRKILGR